MFMKSYSKLTFCDGNTESTLWKYEFTDSEDREKILENIHIGSQFDMRYRGLFLFFGDDLVTYKKKIGSNKNGTEFLRILARYFTNHLEDDAPSSWEECQSTFWEELIFACFPHLMKLSKEQQQSIIFISQLKKFVQWLDKTKGTSCYQFIEKYFKEATVELPRNEKLLNQLMLL